MENLLSEYLEPGMAPLTYAQAARVSGYSEDAMRFIVESLISARRLFNDVELVHVRAHMLCLALAEHAREIFGERAFVVLAKWGLVMGEDVGRIVVKMVRCGLLSASPGDSPLDFRDLPILSSLSIQSSSRCQSSDRDDEGRLFDKTGETPARFAIGPLGWTMILVALFMGGSMFLYFFVR